MQKRRAGGEKKNLPTPPSLLFQVSVNFPPKFQLCLSPRIECKGLRSEKCKVMSSKKMPLWLVFENADTNGEPYLAIFKAGDDLRQDLMTLQLLKIMDYFWSKNGLDLRLNPYGCCATGHDLGMIEVVKNSDTTARIQVEYGGKNMGAWRDTPIDMFLREKNKDAKYERASEAKRSEAKRVKRSERAMMLRSI